MKDNEIFNQQLLQDFRLGRIAYQQAISSLLMRYASSPNYLPQVLAWFANEALNPESQGGRASQDDERATKKLKKTPAKPLKRALNYDAAFRETPNPRFEIGTLLRAPYDTTTPGIVVSAIDRFVVLKKNGMFFPKDVEEAQLMNVGEREDVPPTDRETGSWILLEFLLENSGNTRKEKLRVLLAIRHLLVILRDNNHGVARAAVDILEEVGRDIAEQIKELTVIAKEIRDGRNVLRRVFESFRQNVIRTDFNANRQALDNTGNPPSDEEVPAEYPVPTQTTLPCNEPGNVALDNVPAEVREVFLDLQELELLPLCRFDVIRVLNRAYKHLKVADDEETNVLEVPRMIGGGRTQIGKTILKMVMAMLAHKMGFCSILVSPGQANCLELSGKLRKYMGSNDGNRDLPLPFAVQGDLDRSGAAMRGKDMEDYLTNMFFRKDKSGSGGIAVTNFLHSQLERLRNCYMAIEDEATKRGIVVLLDEADELYKNLSGQNLQEIILTEIITYASLLVEVTATPAPLFANLVRNNNSALRFDDIILLETDELYVSHRDFEVLMDPRTGEPLFLEEKDLTVGNSFLNEKVYALYDDAILPPQESPAADDDEARRLPPESSSTNDSGILPLGQRPPAPRSNRQKRSLVIDMTTSRVHAAGGVSQRSCEILQHYDELGLSLVIILVTGSGMQYRYCGLDEYEEADKWIGFPKFYEKDGKKVRFQLADAIDHIEREMDYFGPIIVMGYTMLFRGISVRNNTRVPTHMVINMSQANSLERVVQAFGRGTGIFRDQLILNGFTNSAGEGVVKVLVFQDDFIEVGQYQDFVNSVQEAMREPSATIAKAVDTALERQNLIAGTSGRPIGQRKMLFREFLIKKYPRHLPIPDSYDFSEESKISRKELDKLCKKYAVDPGSDPLTALREARQTRERLRRENNAALQRAKTDKSEDVNESYGDEVDEIVNLLLKSLGLERHQVAGDGNCFYAALAIAYNGQRAPNEEDVSRKIQDFRNMIADRLNYLNGDDRITFMAARQGTRSFEELLNDIRHNREWADHHEIQAISGILKRKIMVIGPDGSQTLVFDPDTQYEEDDEPLLVFYNGVNHYDALISVNDDEDSSLRRRLEQDSPRKDPR